MKAYRFCLLLVSFSLNCFFANAQAPAWTKAIGGTLTNFNYFSNIKTDTAGNAYLFTYQEGISKYSPEGTLLWTKNIPAESFSKDAAGNVYLTGMLTQNLIIDNLNLTCSSFEIAAFIVKLDPAGNAVWANQSQPKAKRAPNDMPSFYVSKISTDFAGNSLIAGYSYGAATFDTISFTPATYYHPTYFLVKYDQTGTAVWVHENLSSFITDIAFGPQNTYYILDSRNILKCSENGALLWRRILPNSFSSLAQYNAIAVDNQGNCYVSGSTEKDISFDSIALKSSGYRNNFLAKYNSSGNIRWATINKNLSDSSQCNGDALAYKNGQLYLTGTFIGTTTFDKRLPDLATSLQKSQVFVAKFSSDNGLPYWMKQSANATFAQGTALACLTSGEVFTAGFYHPSGCTFDTITLQNTPNSNQNFFVAKLGVSTVLPLEPTTDSEPETSIGCRFCPNPANSIVTINMPEFGNGDAIIYTTAGQKIYTGKLSEKGQLVLNVTGYSAGLYLVKITSDGKTEMQKLIVTH